MDDDLRALERRAAAEPADGVALEALDRAQARAARPRVRDALRARLADALRGAQLRRIDRAAQLVRATALSIMGFPRRIVPWDGVDPQVRALIEQNMVGNFYAEPVLSMLRLEGIHVSREESRAIAEGIRDAERPELSDAESAAALERRAHLILRLALIFTRDPSLDGRSAFDALARLVGVHAAVTLAGLRERRPTDLPPWVPRGLDLIRRVFPPEITRDAVAESIRAILATPRGGLVPGRPSFGSALGLHDALVRSDVENALRERLAEYVAPAAIRSVRIDAAPGSDQVQVMVGIDEPEPADAVVLIPLSELRPTGAPIRHPESFARLGEIARAVSDAARAHREPPSPPDGSGS
jgi:hypothetical protein